MKELEKLHRVVLKLTEVVDVLITIDANTGQNGLEQAREFAKYIPINGVILTKMDGTAKGGIIFPLYSESNIAVKFIGAGEDLDDLFRFNRNEYVQSFLGTNKINE